MPYMDKCKRCGARTEGEGSALLWLGRQCRLCASCTRDHGAMVDRFMQTMTPLFPSPSRVHGMSATLPGKGKSSVG